jgi:ribosomal protein L4
VASLAALGAAEVPTLLVTAAMPDTLARSARNVPWLTVETPTHVSVYQLLHATHIVFERAGLAALEEHLA